MAEGQRHTHSAGSRPSSDCTTSIQKLMATALSVRVSDLTIVTDTAKPTAAASATSCPGLSPELLGRTISAHAQQAQRHRQHLPAA